MKKEVSIVTEGYSIYFGPVLFVLTGNEWTNHIIYMSHFTKCLILVFGFCDLTNPL